MTLRVYDMSREITFIIPKSENPHCHINIHLQKGNAHARYDYARISDHTEISPTVYKKTWEKVAGKRKGWSKKEAKKEAIRWLLTNTYCKAFKEGLVGDKGKSLPSPDEVHLTLICAQSNLNSAGYDSIKTLEDDIRENLLPQLLAASQEIVQQI